MTINKEELFIEKIEDIDNVALKFLQRIPHPAVIAFVAPMGTGKTTFIKALCRAQNCCDVTNSPTFAIVNEYGLPNEGIVFHMDCYRLHSEREALDLGFEEYFYSGNTCYVEWPELVASILPTDTLIVRMETLDDGRRRIYWENEQEE